MNSLRSTATGALIPSASILKVHYSHIDSPPVIGYGGSLPLTYEGLLSVSEPI